MRKDYSRERLGRDKGSREPGSQGRETAVAGVRLAKDEVREAG